MLTTDTMESIFSRCS